jgi:hypothetical protein
MSGAVTYQIHQKNFQNKKLKFENGELKYNNSAFLLITNYVSIYYNEQYKLVNIYDEELMTIFNHVAKVTKINNNLVNSYTNKKGEEKQSISMRVFPFIDEKEKLLLLNAKGRKFMFMIDFGKTIDTHKKNNCLFPIVVHIKLSPESTDTAEKMKYAKHEYENFKFEDDLKNN